MQKYTGHLVFTNLYANSQREAEELAVKVVCQLAELAEQAATAPEEPFDQAIIDNVRMQLTVAVADGN